MLRRKEDSEMGMGMVNSLDGMDVIVFSFTATGTELNRQLCKKLKKIHQPEADSGACSSYAPAKYAGKGILSLPDDKKTLIGSSWGKAAYIFIGAAGIAVRYITPWVKDKYTDSPVLVIDEKGDYVIPLLSGHVGGAAVLADKVADMIGAVAVHTTATDVQGKFAVDVFAKKNGLVITDRNAAKKISSGVLNGEKIALYIEDLSAVVSGNPPDEIVLCRVLEEAGKYDYRIIITDTLNWERYGEKSVVREMDREGCTLVLLLRNIAAGIGCRKNIGKAVLEKGFLEILDMNRLDIRQVKNIASIDLKKNEPALLQLCEKYCIPFETYTAEELNSVSNVTATSEFVKKVTGVDNVCERSARLSCTDGSLLQDKCIREGMTAALVKCPSEIIF